MNHSSQNLKAISFLLFPQASEEVRTLNYRNWSNISFARSFKSSAVLSHRNIGMVCHYLRIQKLLLLLEIIIHVDLSAWMGSFVL